MDSFFEFQKFTVQQSDAVHKVGTDSMVLGALVTAIEPKTCLDIGTGTGVLALMLAQRFKNASILAIDSDPLAVNLAQKNCSESPFAQQIAVQQADVLTFDTAIRFDLIVSNPPYYDTTMHSPDAQKTKAKHEASLPTCELLNWAKNHLTPNGKIVIIVPYSRDEELIRLAKTLQLSLAEKIIVNGKPDRPMRIIFAFTINQSEDQLHQKHFTIRDENGKYTKEYVQATKDFHGKRLV